MCPFSVCQCIVCPSIWGVWYQKASMDKKCVYWQAMCLRTKMCIWRRYVYIEKTCIYGQDMCIRTRHLEYFDQCCCIEVMIRMIHMVFLYLHNSKTSALQQKCTHTSGFINGVCLWTIHLFGIVYNHTYDRIRDSIQEKSSAY